MSRMRIPFENHANGMMVPLKSGDRDRAALIGDVVNPGECGRGRPKLRHVLIGDHHDLAALEILRYGKTGMRRMWKSRRGIAACDALRLRHVGDVENVVAVMPVAHVETIAHAHGMMAGRARTSAQGI